MAILKDTTINGSLVIGGGEVNDFVTDYGTTTSTYKYGSSTGTLYYSYRLWKSGYQEYWFWIEQVVQNNNNSAVITYPKPFKIAPYVIVSEVKNKNTGNDAATGGSAVMSNSTTSLTLSTYSWTNGRYIYCFG